MNTCLVIYASQTGTTELVALEIARRFKQHNWRVDLRRIDQDWKKHTQPIPFRDYDFLCAGSWTYYSLPVPWIQEALRATPFANGIITPGPKNALAFCTYGGEHLGAREADACLTLLEILCEHHGFAPLGSIAVHNRQGIPPANPLLYDPDKHEWPLKQELARLHGFLDQVFERLAAESF